MNKKKGLPAVGLLALAMALPAAVMAGKDIKCEVAVEGIADLEPMQCRDVEKGKWKSRDEFGDKAKGPVRSTQRVGSTQMFYTSIDCQGLAVQADLGLDDPNVRCIISEVQANCERDGAKCECEGKIEGEETVEEAEREYECEARSPVNDFEPLEPFHILFTTSEQFTVTTSHQFPPNQGEISGRASASYHCTAAAANAGLITGWDGTSIVYNVLFSTFSADAVDAVNVQGPVFGPTGLQLAVDSNDLFDGSIASPPLFDEFGNVIPANGNVWTASFSSGEWNGASCGTEFDDPTGIGSVGVAFNSTSSWLEASQFIFCTNLARLYCVSPLLNP